MYTIKRNYDAIIEALKNEIDESDLLNIHNIYVEEQNYMDDFIYGNDEDFFEMCFENKVIEAVRAATYGDYDYSHEFVNFNGMGNLQSFNYVQDVADFEEIASHILDNESDYSDFLELEECYYLELQKELEESNKIAIFEIEVLNTKTNEKEFLTFNIEIDEEEIFAQHEPTTKEEEESNKIAFISVEINEVFSLDEHLEDLYNEAINKINESDFFNLL